jgi:hypothetical protein
LFWLGFDACPGNDQESTSADTGRAKEQDETEGEELCSGEEPEQEEEEEADAKLSVV